MPPTVPPTPASSVSLLVWILIFLAILATALLLWWTLRKARQTALTKTGAEPGAPATGPSAPPYRNAGIPFSFGRAIGFLRARAAGRDYRYQVPWILMLGGTDTGASTVLANAGVSTPLDGQGGPGFGLTHGLEWWFYQHGLVLNPPSDMVLRADGRTSDDNGFDLFLHWLLRKRPRRPLDGVVATIAAGDLLEHRGRSDLILKASILRHKLSLIRRRSSMRLPVYVLVTKCDQVPGFAAFASELAAPADMFGWSNPYPFDAAFSPDWVNQGFEEMGISIAGQQMDVFVERFPVEDSDGVFLFPGQFQRLRDPLRTFLAQLLQDNAYEESFFFRGFYFCGDATPAARPTTIEEPMAMAAAASGSSKLPSTDFAAPRQDDAPVLNQPRTPVFLRDLFDVKVFPESHLARPLSRIDMSRNRTVRTAQILTAAFVIVAAIGTVWGALILRGLVRNAVEPMLDALLSDVKAGGATKARKAGAAQAARLQGAGDTASAVMSNVVLLSGHRLRSAFIPASWDLGFDQKLVDGAALAFQDIVLQAFRAELQNRLTAIATAPTPPAQTDKDGPSFDTPESVPQYAAWTKYVADLKGLEAAAGWYNDLATPDQGTSQEFRQLVQYLNFMGRTPEVPQGFEFDNAYFDRILTKTQNPKFLNWQSPEATARANKLIAGFFDTWYGPRNRIAIDADNIAAGVNELIKPGAVPTYDDLNSLATNIGTAEDDLRNPAFEWVSREQPPDSLTSVFTQALSSAVWLQDLNPARDVDAPAGKAFLQLRQELAAEFAPLTGKILDLTTDPAELSSKVTTLRANISYLLSQTFVARDPGPPMKTAAAHYQWDRASLLEAQKLFDAYDVFERGSLRSMPSYMRGEVRRIAQDRLQDNALDLIGQAQKVGGADETDQELKDFAQSTDVFNSLLAGFAKFPTQTWRHSIETLLDNQAITLLVPLSAQADNLNPYAIKDNGFAWWDGAKPVSLAAFEQPTSDDLKIYLEQTRDQLSAIAQQAAPLIKFLGPQNPSGPASAKAVTRLKALTSDLNLYAQKRPANPVGLLEDFILTGMDKIAPDTSCLDSFRDSTGGTDLFLARRTFLHTAETARCQVLAQMAYTNQIEAAFNANLAGRFPFTAPGKEAGAPEADPAALADFLGKFDQYGKTAADNLKLVSPSSPPRQAALAFLNQIAQIRAVFAAFLAGIAKDPAPSFDFTVGFRVNPERAIDADLVADWEFDVGQQSFKYRAKDNAGVWRLGDPIRIALRFADNSPLVPTADPSQPDLVVNKRIASYEFGGAWSLLRLLLAHKANRGEIDTSTQKPHLLSFYLPTTPDLTLPQKTGASPATGGQVRVYLQLTVIPPGGKDGLLVPLPFPSVAPDLGDKGGTP